MTYRLVHRGEPMPLPRPKVRIMTGRDGKSWPKLYLPMRARRQMNEIAHEWERLCYSTLSGPLSCAMTFAFSRPLHHTGTGKNAGRVKPQYLHMRPGGGRSAGDLDNCCKLVLDALNGVGFADDGQVVRLSAEKLYVDQAGLAEPQTIVEIAPVEAAALLLEAVA